MFHAGYLSPYKETEEYNPNFLEPSFKLIKEEPEYKIEHIVNMRHFGRNKKVQYKVCWKGYTEAHDSWEPVKNIHALELLKEYYQENRTVIHHIHIKTLPLKDEKTSTPYITFTPIPLELPSSLHTMANYISKN